MDGAKLRRRGILAAATSIAAVFAMGRGNDSSQASSGQPAILGTNGNVATADTAIINQSPANAPAPGFVGCRGPDIGAISFTEQAGLIGYTMIPDAMGVYGIALTGSAPKGVWGRSNNGVGVYGDVIEVGIGVQGISPSGLGASFEGGKAPIRLVPGTVAAANLALNGHQAGELYATSDARLFFFTGSAWKELAFVSPQGMPVGIAPAARPSPQNASASSPVQPMPKGRP